MAGESTGGDLKLKIRGAGVFGFGCEISDGAKKKRQPSALHPAGAVPSQGVGYTVTGWTSGRPARGDLIGSAEDFLGALFGYRFRVKTVPSAEPVLNVSSAKLCSLKSQRFTAK